MRAPLEDFREVLSGMAHSGEEQRDPMAFPDRDDPGGEHPGALLARLLPEGGRTLLVREPQHLHGGVIVVNHCPVSRTVLHRLVYGAVHARRSLDQLVLCARR